MRARQPKEFEVHPTKSVDAIQRNFARHLKYSLAKDGYTATDWDRYMALAMMIRNFPYRTVDRDPTDLSSPQRQARLLSLVGVFNGALVSQ